MRRTSGLLFPGFSKRLDLGLTYLVGVPIGRFDVASADTRAPGAVELRYRRWPIVDLLVPTQAVDGKAGLMHGTGFVRLPGGRRWRFCRFVLER